MTSVKRVTVVSSGSPELRHLASKLALDGGLERYVAPFVHSPSPGDRLLPEWVRGILNRRSAPRGVDSEQAVSAAWIEEVIRTAARGRWPTLETRLLRYRNARLSAAAEALVGECAWLIVSHGCALEAAKRERAAKVVLNMQSCHPRTRISILEAELAQLTRRFSATPTRGYSSEALARFDDEYSSVDGVLVGSSFAAQSLTANGVDPERVHVIPYGVDTTRFVPNSAGEGDSRFTVLFVGTVTPGKGIQYLVKAFKEWGKPGAVLQLAGAVPHGLDWLGARDLDMEYLGFLQSADLVSAMQRASVMVFPTLFEGLPLTVLEAMACGLPVIATDRGPDEVIDDGVDGIVVQSSDASAIREGLEDLFSEPEKRRDMSRRARAKAEAFSWNRYQIGALDALAAIGG